MVPGTARQAERCQVLGEVRRERRGDVDALAGERMREREREAWRNWRPRRGSGTPYTGSPMTGRSIAREVDADLVRAPRLERDREERVAADALDQLEVGDRVARRVGVEREADRVVAVAADRRLDPAAARCRDAADERGVGALELAFADEAREAVRVPPRSGRRPSGPTCRGRAGARCRAGPARRPRPCRASRSTSVPLARPAPGWTTRPAGLSTTARCSSCQTIVGGGPVCAGGGAASSAVGSSTARRPRGGSSSGGPARRRAPRRRRRVRPPPASRGGSQGRRRTGPLPPRPERPTPFGGFRSTVTVSRHSRGRRRIASPSRAEGPRPRPCWVGARG